MALFWKDTPKIAGSIKNDERYVLDVTCGTVKKLEDGSYQLFARVNTFSHLQKYGDNNFVLPVGTLIALPMHDKAWKTKKYDNEKKAYTDEEIENFPSIQELSFLNYINEKTKFSQGEFFEGVVELVNNRITKTIVSETDYSNAYLVFDLKESDKKLTEDEMTVKSANNAKKYRTPKEVYEERIAILKLALEGIVEANSKTCWEIACDVYASRTDANSKEVDLAVAFAKLLIK
jgi:hypothetical protein